MSDLLAQMAETSRARCEAARAEIPLEALRRLVRPPARVPLLTGFDLIAEVKRVSPAAGALVQPTGDRAAFAVGQARRYAEAGAALLSVLTEPLRFDGALEDLRAIAEAVPVPAMRKDFLVDPYQVWEARAAGADAVLLIARMLDDHALPAMLDAAAEAGLLVLLEAFDADDLGRCRALEGRADLPALWVGVNTRDLRSLQIDPGRLAALAPLLPAAFPAVAESGILTPEDAAAAARLGYRLALVGTALMRAPDPAAAAAALLAAGRAA